MKELVMNLDFHDNKDKQKALRKVSGIDGVVSVNIDMEKKKMTVKGNVDAVKVISKLRKLCHADIEALGDVKEEKEDGKKDGKKDGKEDDYSLYYPNGYSWNYPYVYTYVDEPPSCKIC